MRVDRAVGVTQTPRIWRQSPQTDDFPILVVATKDGGWLGAFILVDSSQTDLLQAPDFGLSQNNYDETADIRSLLGCSWSPLRLLCMLAITLLSPQVGEPEVCTVRAPCCDVFVPTTLIVTRSISEPQEISVASALRSPDEHSPLGIATLDHLHEEYYLMIQSIRSACLSQHRSDQVACALPTVDLHCL